MTDHWLCIAEDHRGKRFYVASVDNRKHTFHKTMRRSEAWPFDSAVEANAKCRDIGFNRDTVRIDAAKEYL